MEIENLAKIKTEISYPKEYLIGVYRMEEKLINSILQWKKDNDHLKIKKVLKNDKSGKISKVCTEWYIGIKEASNPWHIYRKALRNCFDKYMETFEHSAVMARHMNLLEDYNLQHYMPGEGFYLWHKENNGSDETYKRHLVFMTYLTDTPDAGTEFFYQDVRVPCEKGITLIWPAAWTHTHRGQISLKNEKTIVTGWLSLENKLIS